MRCGCNKRLTVFLVFSFNLFLDGFDANYCASNDPNFDIFSDGVQDCGGIPPSFVYSLSYGLAEDETSMTAYEQRQCTEYGKVREHPRSTMP